MMCLEDVKTENDVVAYCRDNDSLNQLNGISDPQKLLIFYYANYDFPGLLLPETVLAYVDCINRVFGDEWSVHEGWGGHESDSATEAVVNVLNWNMGENDDVDWSAHIAAYEAAGFGDLIDRPQS